MSLPNRMKLRRELTSQRELVRKLQLQSMYGKPDYDLTAAAFLDRDFRKRSAERDVTFNALSKQERLDQFFSMQENNQDKMKQQKRSADGQDSQTKANSPGEERSKVFVPFADNSNANEKSKTPCRQKRSLEDGGEKKMEKRHLKTPPGQGLVPQYNMYDDLCEDNQPVQVVKIKSLVIKDGVIRENDISETVLS